MESASSKKPKKRPYVIESRTQWWRKYGEWSTWKRYETKEQMMDALDTLLKQRIHGGKKYRDFRIKP